MFYFVDTEDELSEPEAPVGECPDFDPETCGPKPLNCMLGYLKNTTTGCDLCECDPDGSNC